MSKSKADWATFAKRNVTSRNWQTIKPIWTAAAANFNYGSVDAIEVAVEAIVGDDFITRDPTTVFNFPGGTVSAFYDAIDSVLRGAYALGAVRNCLRMGQPTWASLEAYHCSLILCRAILGLLGISLVRLKDTNCAVDIFPEGANREAQKAFRKHFGVRSEPARLFYRKRSSYIEQAGVWALLVRTLRMSILPDPLNSAKDAVLDLGDGFGRSRNDILYRNQHWPYAPDLEVPLSFIDIQDDIDTYEDLADFFRNQRDANFAFCRLILGIVRFLVKDIEEASTMASLPGFYAPEVMVFKTFARPR